VLDAARELRYFPDAAARSLARGRSSNIGLILGQPHEQIFIDEYIPNVITGLNKVTKKHGYRMLVEIIDDGSRLDAYVDLVRGKEVAGMILHLNNPSPEEIQKMASFVAEGFPIVGLDFYDQSIPSVRVDKLMGVRTAVKHLIQLGHRRIACISYAPFQNNRHATNRILVYRKTLESSGIAYEESLVRYGNFDPDSGYDAMASLLKVEPYPTAVFAMNDVMAFGAITAIHEHRLRVPEDIAVVGFDNIRLARFTNPPLTTINEPDVEHGRRAGEILVQLIDGQVPPELHVTLGTELIIRESCGSQQ
jgi:DNA-binding LacI/PurR family transcriptional regulator